MYPDKKPMFLNPRWNVVNVNVGEEQENENDVRSRVVPSLRGLVDVVHPMEEDNDVKWWVVRSLLNVVDVVQPTVDGDVENDATSRVVRS